MGNLGIQGTWVKGDSVEYKVGSYNPRLEINGRELVLAAGLTTDLK